MSEFDRASDGTAAELEAMFAGVSHADSVETEIVRSEARSSDPTADTAVYPEVIVPAEGRGRVAGQRTTVARMAGVALLGEETTLAAKDTPADAGATAHRSDSTPARESDESDVPPAPGDGGDKKPPINPPPPGSAEASDGDEDRGEPAGPKFNALRKETGVRVEEVAQQAGMGTSTLYAFLAGRTQLPSEKARAVLDAMGAPPERAEELMRDYREPPEQRRGRPRPPAVFGITPPPAETGQQRPDLREIIPAAQAGEAAAEQTLNGIVGVMLDRTRRLIPPGLDADDVLGAVRERLARHPFDPDRPVKEGTPPEDIPGIVYSRLQRYVGLAVRSAVVDRLGLLREESRASITEEIGSPLDAQPSQTYDNRDVTAALPAEQLEQTLTPRERQVVALRAAGKSNQEIARELGIAETAVKQHASRARTRIENTILRPAGLEPTYSLPDGRELSRLARSGEIQAVNVMGVFYVKEEWLPEDLSQTHIRVSDIATNAEMIAFRRLHPDRLRTYKRSNYILPTDLPLLREIQDRKQGERRAIPPPSEGYVAIPDIAANRTESGRLYGHLRAGDFSDVIRRGRVRFVRAAEAQRFLDAYRQEHGEPGETGGQQ